MQVNIKKIQMNLMNTWIEQRMNQIGIDDDVVIVYIQGLLEDPVCTPAFTFSRSVKLFISSMHRK